MPFLKGRGSKTMLIDWFTVSAQVINFVVLVWLMKHFLYKPILHAIDERGKKIAAQLADAASNKAEAQKEKDEFKKKNEDFENNRTESLKKMNADVQAEREQLLDEAKKAARDLNQKLHKDIKKAQENRHHALIQRAQKEVLSIARKTLKDLAGASLEEQMIDVFIRRLQDLAADEKKRLSSALSEAQGPLLVSTSFDLMPKQKTAIKNTIRELLVSQDEIQFQIMQDQMSGIELNAGGQKVAWNIADYLDALEVGVDEILNESKYENAKSPVQETPGANESLSEVGSP